MYLRILIVGFCAVLLGCVKEIQSTNDYVGKNPVLLKDDIFIDDVQADHVIEGSSVETGLPVDDEDSSGDDAIEGSGEGSGVPTDETDLGRGGSIEEQATPKSVMPSSSTTTTYPSTPSEAPSTTMEPTSPQIVNNNLPEPVTPPVAATNGPSQNTERNDITGMGRTAKEKPSSFLSQPGILAAVIGGAVVGLLCAILLVMFIVYRMRKKDEGSYALDEPKRSPRNTSSYQPPNKEFYA